MSSVAGDLCLSLLERGAKWIEAVEEGIEISKYKQLLRQLEDSQSELILLIFRGPS